MPPSGTKLDLSLTALEQEVLCAVVTKFAADLVLFRLAKPTAEGGAAALEEVATSAAMMLNEKREATQVESLAVQAILESVTTGAPDEFFEVLSKSDTMVLTPARLKHLSRVVYGKLSANGPRAAAA
jgi:hypothetical protein